jgi:hypothetical protein
MRVLKKGISVFFLALFLFPLVQKELHALEHANDFHCSSALNHFHEKEHFCSLCDFIVPLTLVTSQPVFDFTLVCHSLLPFSYKSIFLTSAALYATALRGPPAFR